MIYGDKTVFLNAHNVKWHNLTDRTLGLVLFPVSESNIWNKYFYRMTKRQSFSSVNLTERDNVKIEAEKWGIVLFFFLHHKKDRYKSNQSTISLNLKPIWTILSASPQSESVWRRSENALYFHRNTTTTDLSDRKQSWVISSEETEHISLSRSLSLGSKWEDNSWHLALSARLPPITEALHDTETSYTDRVAVPFIVALMEHIHTRKYYTPKSCIPLAFIYHQQQKNFKNISILLEKYSILRFISLSQVDPFRTFISHFYE